MNVFVVEDSAIVRERLIEMIQDIPEMTITGQADNAQDAVRGITARHPDVVILDIKLAEGTGLDVLQELECGANHPAVIVLTNHATDDFRTRCMALGATHFFDKTNEFEKIRDVLQAMNGHGFSTQTH